MDFLVARDPLLSALHDLLHHSQFATSGDADEKPDASSAAAKAYIRERSAMASTAVDVKEYPSSYVFVADMPGLKSSDIKVTVDNDNVLVLCGERKKEEEGKEVKYLSMERRALKFMRKFNLPSNADKEHISAACKDGVLTVTVPKIPPPTPKVVHVTVN